MTTSDTTRSARFPFGLTLASAIALAILLALGVWQMQRLKWKEALLARVAAVATAPAEPIDPVLAQGQAGADISWRRVSADCAGAGPQGLLYALDAGAVVWRAVALCGRHADGVVVVDRGYVEATRGAMTPPVSTLAQAGLVTGVLRKADGASLIQRVPVRTTGGWRFSARDRSVARALLGNDPPGPVYFLVVDHETPAAAGLTPAPLPTDIPNRHLEYALTWFGLAGVLACFYAAMLWRRLKA